MSLFHRLGRILSFAGVWLALEGGCMKPETPLHKPVSAPDIEAGRPGPVSESSRDRKPDVENGPFRFEMLTPESGFVFEREDDIRGLHRILEANGGGVALFDPDRDGRLDIFMTNGCALPVRPDDRRHEGELFRSVTRRVGDPASRTLRYQPCAGPAHLEPLGYTGGCAVGDYDADGFDDLYVTAFGPNSLWHNNGDGTFSDVTAATGTAVPQWSSSAAFGDLNLDGDLDLFVVNYLEESAENPRLCRHPDSPEGYVQCAPAVFEGVDDVLFLSDGAGGFADATEASGLRGLRGKGLGVLIAQLDEDPLPEIFVTNDGEANFLLDAEPALNSLPSGNGSTLSIPGYMDRAMQSGVGLNESGFAQANMGIAAGDCDGDHLTDLLVTTFYNDSNTLYANKGNLQFEDATRRTRAGAGSRQGLGFGTLFFDADNDGWLDLFVTNGHVDDRTWMKTGEPYRMRPLLYRNEGAGAFREISNAAGPYFRSEWVGRGVASGDLDGDGRLDLVVSHQRSPSVAIRNQTAAGFAISLRVVGRSINRNGFGTIAVARSGRGSTGSGSPMMLGISRELFGGGSFQSASTLAHHVGTGAEREITCEMRWSAAASSVHRFAIGNAVIVEGQGVFSLPE